MANLPSKSGYPTGMTENANLPRTTDPEPDQDSESTMTAPPEDRPDAAASALNQDGRADSPDIADADGEPPV
jgi:hypothetical protein